MNVSWSSSSHFRDLPMMFIRSLIFLKRSSILMEAEKSELETFASFNGVGY